MFDQWKKTVIAMMGVVLLSGCGGGGSGNSGSGGGGNDTTSGADTSALQAIPVEQSILITIPTYDGHNQVVHPDIITHNGLFYLTITPYPWSNVNDENPSFYSSADGLNFTPTGQNPIVNHPDGGYNDDPDLIIDPLTGMFSIYYNETPKNYNKQYLALLRSPDGVEWTDHRKLVEFRTGAGEPFIVSPAVVYYAGHYFMFHVEVDTDEKAHSPNLCTRDPHKHQIKVMFSEDGVNWDKHKDEGINIDFPADFNPWHMNIVQGNGHFYMLVNGYRRGFCDRHYLYLAVSDDLANWHFIDRPIVTASKEFFDSKIIYRSAAIVEGDNMYVYFSFYKYDRRWMLGIKHILISDYIK